MTTRSDTLAKLRDHQYRKRFVRARINFNIPFQIRSLMKQRGWTQDDLAKSAGMLQPRISAMLKAGKNKPNLETLCRLADAFDIGLEVRFAAFSDLVRWSDQFDPDNFNVSSFEEDPGCVEKMQTASKQPITTNEVRPPAWETAGIGAQYGRYVTATGSRVLTNTTTIPRYRLVSKETPKLTVTINSFVPQGGQDARF